MDTNHRSSNPIVQQLISVFIRLPGRKDETGPKRYADTTVSVAHSTFAYVSLLSSGLPKQKLSVKAVEMAHR